VSGESLRRDQYNGVPGMLTAREAALQTVLMAELHVIQQENSY